MPDTGRAEGLGPRQVSADQRARLEKLLRDPSLRLKEDGRSCCASCPARPTRNRQCTNSPRRCRTYHCPEAVAVLAKEYVTTWLEFAQGLI
ncbi:hypothetical protein A6A06_20545 [Streptomyces sp. CB02923]|uniref:hypothetical protein n=1 Tax=Streptomyces sp. CB02923 TaxID=1718985 RepID=UPI00093F443B|nr:hypothetical protein [Streptomyces sp. CB02923]OKI01208.1 hypothetical protein A6A06_20545 [Streptomyces sp. CB02923]